MYKEIFAILVAASTLIGYPGDDRREGPVESRVTAAAAPAKAGGEPGMEGGPHLVHRAPDRR
jgi:hypothetical protein